VLVSSSLCRAEKEWFALDSNGVWRSFHTEAEWLKLGKEISPQQSAILDRRATYSLVTYYYFTESEDWQYTDKYVFHANGSLSKLERTFLSSSQRIKRIDTYKLNKLGEIQHVATHEVSVTTGKETSVSPEAPEIPIAKALNQMPFMKGNHEGRP
jgi:hypothetical protein